MIKFGLLTFLIITFFVLKAEWLFSQPKIVFKQTELDFGKIKEGEISRGRFFFKNEGNLALKILRVRASCGCTTPGWSRNDILPGDTSSISVEFNSFNRIGYFTKTISISSNTKLEHTYLVIKGKVIGTEIAQVSKNPKSMVSNSQIPNSKILNSSELISETDTIDLGKIEKGQKISYQINLINQSKNKVKINKIYSSSPLLSWEMDKEYIKPGKNGSLKMIFDSGNNPLQFSGDLIIGFSGSVDSELKIMIRVQVVESIVEQSILKTDKRMGF